MYTKIEQATKMVIKGKFHGGLADIEYTEGQVWLMVFWATWCEPA